MKSIVLVGLLLVHFEVVAQSPPQLRDGRDVQAVFNRLLYRDIPRPAQDEVITVRFQIRRSGFLDTLHITPFVSDKFYQVIYDQLAAYDGHWQARSESDPATGKEWLACHVYAERSTSNSRRQFYSRQAFKEAYRQEVEQYQCYRTRDLRIPCRIPFVQEGNSFFFLPNYLSYIVCYSLPIGKR